MTVTGVLALLHLLGSPAQATEYWEGTYDCPQGETGLTLSFEPAADNAASALFHFYATPGNPGVPEGCFTMSGTLNQRTRQFDFQARRWLLQPRNYVTVDLHGTLQNGSTSLQGIVTGPGCTTFVLHRVSHALRPTAACYPALVS